MEMQLQDMRMEMPNGAVVSDRIDEPRSEIVELGRFALLLCSLIDC